MVAKRGVPCEVDADLSRSPQSVCQSTDAEKAEYMAGVLTSTGNLPFIPTNWPAYVCSFLIPLG